MRFLLVSPKNRTVYNFRGNLVREIVGKGHEVTVAGPDRTDVDRIEALGASFRVVPMDKDGTGVLSDLRYCLGLHRLMRELRPDRVLAYTVKPVVYGTIAGRLAGVSHLHCLVTGGGYAFTGRTPVARAVGLVVRLLYRIALGLCETAIFQNGDDRDEFVARGLVAERKCRVVSGSGVDMERFRPEPCPEGGIRFLMISRLLRGKGVVEYLRAARKVKAVRPWASFVLLGRYEDAMRDAVPREEVEPFVRDRVVERHDETADVRPYYRDCGAYVLPSYREGTPRTVLEAMATGRPVITTDANGCRDTVVDGRTGFLVPVGDVDALAGRMLFLVDHPEAVPVMGAAAREYCASRYEVGLVDVDMLRHMDI